MYDMRINARLEPALAKKLSYLKAKSGDSTSDVLKRALELYYQQEAEQSASPFKILEDSGFVGCAPGPSNLSERYKDELTKSLRGKLRAHRR